MRTYFFLARLVGVLPALSPHTACAEERRGITITPSASIDSLYLLPQQLTIVDNDGARYHEGIEFALGRASFSVDGYQYGADGRLHETDYTFSLSASCPLGTTCVAEVAEWVIPSETIVSYKLTISGGREVSWNITFDHQDGETYEANLVEVEISGDFHPFHEWHWFTLSSSIGITHDFANGSSGVFGSIGPKIIIGNFTLSAGLQGFERVSGDGDRSGLSFGLSGSVPFNLF